MKVGILYALATFSNDGGAHKVHVFPLVEILMDRPTKLGVGSNQSIISYHQYFDGLGFEIFGEYIMKRRVVGVKYALGKQHPMPIRHLDLTFDLDHRS
jgi:hypothetical protein